MGKRSSRELVGDIAGALTNDPQSIQEISNAVNADRQSVTKYLEELRDAGIVKEDKSGRTREFYVSEYEDNETYFELPLSNEERKQFKALFGRIFEKYYEKFNKTPSKLMSQKIAVKVIKELNLELPFGRYQYGSITAMNFTPGDGSDVGPVDFGPNFEETVEETAEEYGNLGFHEARKKQYREEDMELYQIKEDIMASLASEINDVSEFERDLYMFLAKTPELEEEIEEALVDFISISTDLVDKAFNRSKVMETFKEFWELIAFYCLEHDMGEYYDEETLRSRMESDRKEKKDEVMQAMSELVSLHEDEKNYDVSEDMENLETSDGLSEEERQEREEELEDMDSSDVAGEFDLES